MPSPKDVIAVPPSYRGLIQVLATIALGVFLLSFSSSGLESQAGQLEYNAIQARENFRLGVNAYNFGYYNRAVASFEQSLALRPDSPDTQFWLGRSYYTSGYTKLAMDQWGELIQENQASSPLISFYNTINHRYKRIDHLYETSSLSLLQRLQSEKGAKRSAYFTGVISSASAPDREGTYLVDYHDNKVVILDVNGRASKIIRGGFTKVFNQPFDILLTSDGGFILSQTGTNSLVFCDANGNIYKEVGSTGSGPENFLGPQHLSDSGDGYFYVSDWGNRRITKLDYQGNFIFSFGKRNKYFEGLKGPTGIAVYQSNVYVADAINQSIYVFDSEGVYLKTLISKGLSSPESLLFTPAHNLLIADTNKILKYSFDNASLTTIYRGDDNQQFKDISYDRNRNLVASDFRNERVDILTQKELLYTDLFVEIKHIINANYPDMAVDVLVQNRNSEAVIDLKSNNFTIEENNQIIPSSLQYSSTNDKSLSIALIAGGHHQDYNFSLIPKITPILEAGDLFRLFHENPQPSLLTNQVSQTQNAIARLVDVDQQKSYFGQTLRFTLDSLSRDRKHKVVIYINDTNNPIETNNFDLTDLSNYLETQNASFFAIVQNNNELLKYLAEKSGGRIFTNMDTRELMQSIQQQRAINNGYYSLKFRSVSDTDLARRYVPVNVTVRYLKLSGKDSLGFFAPLGGN